VDWERAGGSSEGYVPDLGESELDSPHLSLILQAISANLLELVAQSLLLEGPLRVLRCL